MNYEVKEVLDKLEEDLYSKAMVIELSDVTVTEYARGVVYGRIEMLNKLKFELLREDDDEEDSKS